MKTEIQGDFKGYFLRFKMPSKRCFSMPLKSAGLIFLFELVLSGILIYNTPHNSDKKIISNKK